MSIASVPLQALGLAVPTGARPAARACGLAADLATQEDRFGVVAGLGGEVGAPPAAARCDAIPEDRCDSDPADLLRSAALPGLGGEIRADAATAPAGRQDGRAASHDGGQGVRR